MVKQYIDNKEFEKVIGLYLKSKVENESELVRMLTLLVNNIVDSYQFAKIESEDAKQESLYLILKILPNFNSDNGSAFNYFSTVILNNLKLMYTKQKRYDIKIERYSNHLERISKGRGGPKF